LAAPSASQRGVQLSVMARVATCVVSWVVTTCRPNALSSAQTGGLTVIRSVRRASAAPSSPEVTAAIEPKPAGSIPSRLPTWSVVEGTSSTVRCPQPSPQTALTAGTARSASWAKGSSAARPPSPRTRQ